VAVALSERRPGRGGWRTGLAAGDQPECVNLEEVRKMRRLLERERREKE